jgi:aminopeptidase N
MAVLTLIFAITAIVAIGYAIRLLSRPTEERAGRGWRVALLLVVACAALGLGGYNAVLVQRRNAAKQAVERGRELMQRGKTGEAEQEFRRAQELDPKSKAPQEELDKVAKARDEARRRAEQGTGTVAPGGAGGAAGAAGRSAPAGHPQRRESQVRITRYEIDVTLDVQKHSLSAEARFVVQAKRGTVREFDLALSPQCAVQLLTVGGKSAERKREGEWLTITSQRPIDARQGAEVYIRYKGFGKNRLLPAGDVLSPEGSYLRPESRWCPAIGYLEFRSPVTARVTVPRGQMALGPGRLVAQQPAPDGGTTYVWECPQNAMGVALAAGPWQKLEGKAGDLPVTVLLWKKHASRAAHILAVTKRAVALFEELYGPFPYDKLALGEIPFFPGGYSPSSMILLGEILFEDNRRIAKQFDAIIAHEVAHQWWGNLVVPQGPGAGWLAEGFAEYASILYVGETSGEKAFRRALWDAKQQYHFLNQNPPEEAIIDTDPFNQQGSYTGVVYSKGAYVLHMLRQVIGDDAFRAALRGFLDDRRFGVGTIDEFRAEAEEHSGRKLDGFFNQWLERVGTIELVYDWQARSLGGGEWETIVTLDQTSDPPYKMPIDLQIVTRAGRSLDTGELTGTHSEFRFVTRDEPQDIDIDPRDNLLLAVPKRKSASAPQPSS